MRQKDQTGLSVIAKTDDSRPGMKIDEHDDRLMEPKLGVWQSRQKSE